MPTDQNNKKPTILMLCNYYLPGYKGGGGLRTLVHTVERFRDKFDFKVITNDNDGDGIQYKNIKVNDRNDVQGAEVFYLQQNLKRISKLRELIIQLKPGAIYLNSVFSVYTIMTLLLRRFRLIPPIKIILAPEGELSDGALQLKARKKKAYLALAKNLGLYKNLIWKTTSELEKKESFRIKGKGGEIFIAPNIPAKHLIKDYRQEQKPEKNSGEAKIIFLSRFMQKKNFKWLLDNLQNIEGELKIDIVGPIEDAEYWEETKKTITKLPKNIRIEYKGSVVYEKVSETLLGYQFFILPTLGENFGHVFIEALAAGCPIIISDRTPWLNLEEKKIGWDLSLDEPQKWNETLNQCIKMDELSYSKLSGNAREFACQWLADPKVEEDTLRVLRFALSGASGNAA
jgi:glycosyltransferase involved in cell wall biosynthesis